MIGLLLAAAMLGRPARAQVEVSASTTTAELAAPVTLSVRASLPADAALTLDLPRSTTDTFSIGKVEASAPGALTVQILPLSIGKLPIPLFWTLTEGGKARSLASAPVVLDVTGPPVGPTTQIEDIRPPARAARLWWPWLLALLAAAAAAYYAHRRLNAPEEDQAPAGLVDDRPAHVIALEALAALRASPLWAERRFKEFYAALTDAVRLYLERRYEVPATRLTTAEVLRHLKQCEVDRGVVVKLRALFDRADLVKFAKLSPEESWGGADLDAAVFAVETTKPPPSAGTANSPPALSSEVSA